MGFSMCECILFRKNRIGTLAFSSGHILVKTCNLKLSSPVYLPASFVHRKMSSAEIHFCNLAPLKILKIRILLQSHEIDYKIIGHDVQLVEVELDPGETVIAEAGVYALHGRWH